MLPWKFMAAFFIMAIASVSQLFLFGIDYDYDFSRGLLFWDISLSIDSQ